MAEVIVEYDYQAKEPDELTIKKGDVIRDVTKKQGGWWEGVLNDKKGMFPDNFVRCLESDPIILRNKKEVARIRQCRVVFSYSQDHEDELNLKVGDVIDIIGEEEEGWWRGVLKGKEGVFPSNFVEVINQPPKPKPNVREDLIVRNSVDAAAPSLPAKPVKQLCEVKFSYKAQNEDELSLKEGEVVTLLSKEATDPGWWKGELNGKIGVFPDNFVVLLPNNDDKTVKDEKRPSSGVTATSLPGAIKPSSVASQRKSLEVKEDRKSIDKSPVEPKVTPPVPGKKPIISLKKSPSGSSTGGLFSEIKKKLVDVVDGASGSKAKTEEKTAEVKDKDGSNENVFDQVERRPLLQDVRASRAKAPGRRLPATKSVYKEEEEEDTPEEILNGTSDVSESESHLNSSNELDPSDNKPKLREWEKHKAPWLEEMKLNQAKRSSTSPGPESKLKLTPAAQEPEEQPKSAKSSPVEKEVSPVDMSKSMSSINTKIKTPPSAPTATTWNNVAKEPLPTKPKVSPVATKPPKPIVEKPVEVPAKTEETESGVVTPGQYNELLERIKKLESVVEKQQHAIEELKNRLQVETDMRMLLQEKISQNIQV